MKILINLKNLLISPRFQSFYWRVGLTAVAGFLNLVAENITGLGLPLMIIPFLGMALAEITKALNNLANDKAMGFAPKK